SASLCANPLDAGEVLPEVKHVHTRLRISHRLRLKHLMFANRRKILPDNLWFPRLDDLYLIPLAVVKGRSVPFGLPFPPVVRFAVIDFREHNWRHICFPTSVRRDPLHRTVFVLNSQLSAQRGRCLSVIVSLPVPLQWRRIPSRREQGPDRVL